MASVFTHAALPLLAARALPGSTLPTRRLAVVGAVLACVGDLDLLGFAFDVRPEDLWGHRGLTHSLPFALALALLGTFAFPKLARFSRGWWGVFAFLLFAAASHGLVDALTRGEVGVALFSPLSRARLHFPFRPIPSSPLGVPEALSRWGAQVLLNEALLLVAPLALACEGLRRARAGAGASRRATLVLVGATALWAATVGSLQVAAPGLFAPSLRRVLNSFGDAGSDQDPVAIPRRDLPGQRLVTRFDELRALGLLDRDLSAATTPWSSGFFPAWFGGAAGRWQDARPRLIWRTLAGFEVPSEADVRAQAQRAQGGDAEAADALFRLSPSEKYDLALADYALSATRRALASTHNADPRPRFWFGLCNGVAAAGIDEPEPFRTVDVTSPDGVRVRFHPNDVKALLALSYYWMAEMDDLGGSCDRALWDSGRVCSINPGGLVLALANRLGLAKRAVLVDVHPSWQSQYYAVPQARIDVVRGPYPHDGSTPTARSLEGRVAQLVDVAVTLVGSSTVLPASAGAVPEGPDGTRFQKVGLHPVQFHYQATLALDAQGEIVGGRWTGDPPDGPDSVAFGFGGPELDGGTLELNPSVRWDVVQAIARASAQEGPPPALDLRTFCDGGPCAPAR